MTLSEIRKSAPPDANGYRIERTGKKHARYYKITGGDVYAWNFRKWVKVVNNQSTWTIKPL